MLGSPCSPCCSSPGCCCGFSTGAYLTISVSGVTDRTASYTPYNGGGTRTASWTNCACFNGLYSLPIDPCGTPLSGTYADRKCTILGSEPGGDGFAGREFWHNPEIQINAWCNEQGNSFSLFFGFLENPLGGPMGQSTPEVQLARRQIQYNATGCGSGSMTPAESEGLPFDGYWITPQPNPQVVFESVGCNWSAASVTYSITQNPLP